MSDTTASPTLTVLPTRPRPQPAEDRAHDDAIGLLQSTIEKSSGPDGRRLTSVCIVACYEDNRYQIRNSESLDRHTVMGMLMDCVLRKSVLDDDIRDIQDHLDG